MPERIPQSATIRVPLQAYLSSDHVSPATGKTIAVTISKNGAAYGNPSGGATNATEIASGSYYVDLSTTDAGTVGPLFVLGTAASTDAVVAIYDVVKATNGGFTGVPDAVANADGGLPILSSSGTTLGYTLSTLTTYTGDTPQTGDAYARIGALGAGLTAVPASGDFTTTMKASIGTAVAASDVAGVAGVTFPATVASPTNITAGTITTVTNLTNAPTAGDLTATMKTSVTTAATAATPVAASVTAAVTVDKTMVLSAARDVSAVADTSLTLNDALHCAIAAAAGKETVVGTAYTVKTPSTGTTLRIFTLDSSTAPSSRT